MKDKSSVLIGSGVFGLLAGFAVMTGSLNLKNITVGALLALPAVFVTHLVADTQATKRVNEADEKINNLQRELRLAANTKALLETKQTEVLRLSEELTKVRSALKSTFGEHQLASDLNLHLQHSLTALTSDLEASREKIEELQAECETWEEEFSDRVSVEAEARFQVAKRNEIERIFQEHDTITSQAMALFRQLQQWGEKVAHGHQSKREIIQSLAASYNQNLDELGQSVEQERGHYLTQIELLNERVGQLQHQLAGDLIEPIYLDCGFDENGKIANALANWLWVHRKIALKVTGFEPKPDGTLTTGYTYSRSVTPETLIQVIEKDSPLIARNLGLYALEGIRKLQVTDCLTVTVRRERPARKADKGSLYRSKEEFINYILSQPVRLRLIGDPGSGKTPSVTVLLAHILKRGFLEANTPNGRKLPYCVVESCNPLAGISVKNGDELDFCLKWNSGAKGFKGLAEEYRFRKNPANADYKNQVGYVWVADEIDNSMADLSKDEAKPFKDALKDGGHVNLGVIVMGQSANVSTSKGLSIDDQKMLTNIYIDSVSIRTFLTQYGERFYSKRAVEKALATLAELELEIEEKNEVICDTAREFRIAMVTASRSPVFYQLPYFDSVDIDLEAYRETLAKAALIRATKQQPIATTDKVETLVDIEIADTVAGAGATPTQVSCPKCAGTVKRNGKTSTGVQKYLCKNADCKYGFSD